MIVATILVHQCDNCIALVALKTTKDWRTFEATWHNGKRYDFCPKCRYKIETQSRILQDETRDNKPLQIAFEDETYNAVIKAQKRQPNNLRVLKF